MARCYRRRELLAGGLAAGTCLAITAPALAASLFARSVRVTIENFADDGKSLGFLTVARLVRTDEEWRQQLSAPAFEVTRRGGTEQPFSGEYSESYVPGLYHCVCCDIVLFDSRTKYDSHTGWPSFWKPISRHNVLESVDDSFGMRRTAVICPRCDAHLGHVFADGPRPTGLRYCMNSVALRLAVHPLG